MRVGPERREPARLTMHLPAGYCRVLLERTVASGQADGGVTWDLPIDVVPRHLRTLGSQFVVGWREITPEAGDPPQVLRSALRDALWIEEPSPGDAS
jgi:hypothetical protein